GAHVAQRANAVQPAGSGGQQGSHPDGQNGVLGDGNLDLALQRTAADNANLCHQADSSGVFSSKLMAWSSRPRTSPTAACPRRWRCRRVSSSNSALTTRAV